MDQWMSDNKYYELADEMDLADLPYRVRKKVFIEVLQGRRPVSQLYPVKIEVHHFYMHGDQWLCSETGKTEEELEKERKGQKFRYSLINIHIHC